MGFVEHDFEFRTGVAADRLKARSRLAFKLPFSYGAIAPLAMGCDALIILAASLLSGIEYHYEIIGRAGNVFQFFGAGAVTAVLFVTIGESRGLYQPSELLNLKSQAYWTAARWVGVFLFLSAIAFSMKIGTDFSRGATLLFVGVGLAALISERICWRVFLANGLAARRFSGSKVALIHERSATLNSELTDTLARHGLQPVQHFALPTEPYNTHRQRELVAQVISSVRGSAVEKIILGIDLHHWSHLKGLLQELRVLPLPVELFPLGASSELLKFPLRTIGTTTTIELQHGPRTLLERAVKRTIDIGVAIPAVLLLLPLFIMTAIAIKLDSPGPVIFRQRRNGFNGRQFQIFKFRTMSVLEDGAEVVQADRNDRRITRLGTWLRRTSIDELPQLMNVLLGSMSIVGPRPHATAHDDYFDEVVSNYAYRHHVKPGLTGWAQVNGCRGKTSTVADIERRVALDLWYIDNWNLFIDLKIILMTVIEVFRGENAY